MTLMTLKELKRAIQQMEEILMAAGVDEGDRENAEVFTDEDGLNLRAKKGEMEICLSSNGREGGR